MEMENTHSAHLSMYMYEGCPESLKTVSVPQYNFVSDKFHILHRYCAGVVFTGKNT